MFRPLVSSAMSAKGARPPDAMVDGVARTHFLLRRSMIFGDAPEPATF
jgi:hypothetical protein